MGGEEEKGQPGGVVLGEWEVGSREWAIVRRVVSPAGGGGAERRGWTLFQI
jgi:hypothetical protein